MLKKFLKKSGSFWQETEEIFFWVLLFDYVFLVLWEYLIPGMVFEIFNPQWLFLGSTLILASKYWRKESKQFSKILPQIHQERIGRLIFSGIFFLIFVNWLTVGLWTAFFFTLFSFLTLKFLSEFFSD